MKNLITSRNDIRQGGQAKCSSFAFFRKLAIICVYLMLANDGSKQTFSSGNLNNK
jgi:hypothetical protein